MSRLIITTYVHLSRTKPGRKALIKSDAIFQIRKFCDSCPSEKTFDDIIQRVAGLVATCYRKDSLPLENLESPIQFQVPNSGDKVQECGSSSDDEGSDEEDNSENGSGEELSDDELEKDFDSKGESSEDEDDDDKAIVEPRPSKIRLPSRRGSGIGGGGDQPSKGSTPSSPTDDTFKLSNYSKFFSEFEMTRQGLITRKVSGISSPISPSLASLLDENLNETQKPKGIPKSEHNYSWITENKDCQYVYWTSISELRRQYAIMANSVSHVSPFVKIAYPDFAFGYSLKSTETLLPTADRYVLR